MRDRNLNKSMDTLFPQPSNDRCRVCHEPVVDGRWNYCSERCRDIANAVQAMFLWDKVREKVLDRDEHTCQHCGLSYTMAKRAYWQTSERVDELAAPIHPKKGDHPAGSYDRWRRVRAEFRERYGWLNFTDGKFHVDHITPISQGGHPFDESNLQVLCDDCHEAKTAEENSGTARERPEISLQEYMDS
ncbi:HNH endonuclease [Haloarcula sp. JP-L23]|uniref:HNH endonuclease n=1 Tax=Haloarcula sp. JP-L23 TaxID=2716717 RepID=UPI001D041F9F